MTKYAYGRVSTEEQNLDMQLQYFNAMGVQPDNIYTEKLSGKDTNRPTLHKLLSLVKQGDEVYIYSLSRLGRSTKDLLDLFEKFKSLEVRVISSKENIDTSTPVGNLMLTLLSAVAQFERETTISRIRDGVLAARFRGEKFGRPTTSRTKLEAAQALLDVGKSRKEVVKITGIGARTLERYLSFGVLVDRTKITEVSSDEAEVS